MSTPEGRKLLSETVKNYCTAVAIIFGGLWALVQFRALVETERAWVALENERTTLEISRLELELNRLNVEAMRRTQLRDLQAEAVLQLEITTDAIVVGETGAYLVVGTVAIENVSDVRTEISLDPARSRLGLIRIAPAGNTVVAYDPQIYRPRDHDGPIDGVVVLPGRRTLLPFAFWVDQPGVYQVTFEAEVTQGASVADEILRQSLGLARFVWQEVALVPIPPSKEGG